MFLEFREKLHDIFYDIFLRHTKKPSVIQNITRLFCIGVFFTIIDKFVYSNMFIISRFEFRYFDSIDKKLCIAFSGVIYGYLYSKAHENE